MRHQLPIAIEVLLLEARMGRTPAIDVGERLDRPGQKAAPQRRIGDEADPELARRLARLFRLLPVQQRVLGLHRRDRMHRVRAPYRRRRCLGQPEMPRLALLHQLRHRADRVLDRHRRIDAVLVVEVDHLDAQPLQARLARLHHVLGPAVHAVRAAGVLRLAELGCQHHTVAAAFERPADHLLIMAPAVHVGRIEMIDALVDGVADQLLRGGVIGFAVDAGQ